MKTLLTCCVVLATVFALVMPASASFIWDGAGDPALNGFSNLMGIAPTGFRYDQENGAAHVGTLYQDTREYTSSGSRFGLAAGTASSELVNANGWSMELRQQTISSSGGHFGASFVAADNVGGVGVLLCANRIEFFSAGWDTYTGAGAIDGAVVAKYFDLLEGESFGDYHAIGIKVAPGASVAHAFVDGIDVGTTIPLTAPGPNMWFGDGSGGDSAVVNWDSVRLNAVPEPSVMALCVPGVIGLLCYAWRKQK
jgi:hypothetical protein